ncbi:MAG: YraN family protein [Gammaproteobacteria bacterium]|nr:MAG: YraN family protein [Gammaproteobacteria bacterium]
MEYLTGRGLKPRERNVRGRGGEIDLVMQDGETVVFVEVRYRHSERFGGALRSVDGAKQRRLLRTAEAYLQQHWRSPPPCRIDVLAVGGSPEAPVIEWIRNAIEA